jgi:hypothetical protein
MPSKPSYVLCKICGRTTGRSGNIICAFCANELDCLDLPICSGCGRPRYPNDISEYKGRLLCLDHGHGFPFCHPG